MSKNKTKKYEGSEHELHARTLELDELHHDVGMPAMADALAAMRGTSRRTFLMGAGAAVAGGAALAVGSGAVPDIGCRLDPPLSHVGAAAFPPAGLKGDLAVAAVAASLENLAVFAYTAGLSAGDRGEARHGAAGRGHLRHDGQGAAPAARSGVERRAASLTARLRSR